MKNMRRLVIITFVCIAGLFFVYPETKVHAALYPSIFGDNTYEWITNVTFGDINKFSSQNSHGYGDYTFDESGITTRVKPGTTYPLSVIIQPDTEWCDEYITAFFDWNHDGDFTDSGEALVVVSDTCIPGPHAINVKVPWNAAGGETRMRIVLKYYGAPLSYGDIPEGEAEDYTIVVNYPPLAGDVRSEWITNVTIESINNTTGPIPGGYGDYSFWATGEMAATTQGEVYPLSVTISPDTSSCDENITAFFDWNHDGDFEDTSEKQVVATKTCSPGPHVKYIKIPHFADLGRTRMRIVLRWLFTPVSSGYISGEGEDYTLFVSKISPWILFIPAIVGHK